MNRSALILIALAGAAVLVLVVVVANPPTFDQAARTPPAIPGRQQPPSNVVLISIDCLRFDRTRAAESNLTVAPTLQRLSGSTANFTRATTVAPWTLPAVASMMTGVYPALHGATAVNPHELVPDQDPSLPTLAELLATAGYSTGAFIAHAVLADPKRHHAKGFASVNPGLPRDFVGKLSSARLGHAFATWLPDQSGTAPLFAWLHFMEPHQPPTAGNPYLQSMKSTYDAEVRYVDEAVARVIELLRQTGRWDDTLLVITSDHGEELGDHGDAGHQHTLFDELLHVPLMIRFPGDTFRGDYDVRVETLSIAPTILEWVGVERPEHVSGRSLLPLLRGDRFPSEPTFASRYFVGLHHLFAVHDDDWKLIYAVPYEGVRHWRPSLAERASFPPNATATRRTAERVVADQEIPNIVSLRFGDVVELVGWQTRRSHLRPSYHYLDLYWRVIDDRRTVPYREVGLEMVNGHTKVYRSLIADGDVPTSVWKTGGIVRETLWVDVRADFDLKLKHVSIQGGDRQDWLPNAKTGELRDHLVATVRLHDLQAVDPARGSPATARDALKRIHDWSTEDDDVTVKLFNLADDPRERHSLYWEDPATSRRLEELLERWRAQLAVRRADKPPSQEEVSEETVEKLRSLGYVD